MPTHGRPVRLPGMANARGRVLACGADSGNRFCISEDGLLRLSGDNGDMADPAAFLRCRAAVVRMAGAAGGPPDVVAHDLHPGYLSTLLGDVFPGARMVGVQHHHAHIATMLAAAGGEGPVIGVAFDGTGYGTDGAVWGGEFLVVSRRGWARRGHLEYMPMPGGEAAVREPWRMAFAFMRRALGAKAALRSVPGVPPSVPREALRVLGRMIDAGVHCPPTSSCGRLFDAVAAILGLARAVSPGAAAAIALERAAAAADDAAFYPFEITDRDGVCRAWCGPVLDGILGDGRRGVPVERIARRFHNSVARLILEVASRIRGEAGVGAVAMGGGVFMNRLLASSARALLEEAGFRVLDGGPVPAGDAGLCVGQAFVAGAGGDTRHEATTDLH
ncbi:MAG: carbamoyltransferase HypF [bacterium]|nr:carbamoyltransferase HypF [bacterium]